MAALRRKIYTDRLDLCIECGLVLHYLTQLHNKADYDFPHLLQAHYADFTLIGAAMSQNFTTCSAVHQGWH